MRSGVVLLVIVNLTLMYAYWVGRLPYDDATLQDLRKALRIRPRPPTRVLVGSSMFHSLVALENTRLELAPIRDDVGWTHVVEARW